MPLILPTRRSLLRSALAAPALLLLPRDGWSATGIGTTGAGGPVSGGAAWDPSQDANLKGWWKSTAGVTSSSGVVSTWADQSGNGNTLTAGSNQVLLNATSFNGHPGLGVSFLFGGDVMLKSGFVFNSATCSWFASFMVDTSSGNNFGRLLSFKAVGNTNDWDNNPSFEVDTGPTHTNVQATSNAGVSSTIGTPFSPTTLTPMTAGVVFDGTNATFYINGTAQGSTMAHSVNLGGGSGVDYRIFDDAFSDFSAATFAEHLVSTSVLSATNYQNYAHTTWGI